MKFHHFWYAVAVVLLSLSTFAQTNTPSPSLPISVPVTVQNTPLPVNAVDIATRSIVRLGCDFHFSDIAASVGNVSLLDGNTYVVPDGKRLVINNMWAVLYLPKGQLPVVVLSYTSSGWEQYITLEARKLPYGGFSEINDQYVMSLNPPLYVDAGGSLKVDVTRSFPSGEARLHALFQGYLVACGTGCTTTQ